MFIKLFPVVSHSGTCLPHRKDCIPRAREERYLSCGPYGHMTERNYRTRGLAYGEDIHTLIFREACA